MSPAESIHLTPASTSQATEKMRSLTTKTNRPTAVLAINVYTVDIVSKLPYVSFK
jgi:hypothetical protein